MGPIIRLLKLAAQAAALTGLLWLPGSVLGTTRPAAAQTVSLSVEFRTALEPYGSFRRIARWGDVWVPAHVSREWRPYTVGHWVYSDDYGWYWVSDRDEAPWGWVAFHYGRWVWDRDVGWAWVPGRQWGPAWVEWRRGSRHVGWAPLPPDDIIVEVRDEARYWIFVRPRDFLATSIATVIVEPEPAILHETVVVNETVVIRQRNFAVNPGIEPAFLAAEIGRPIPAFQVQPRILAGTANIPGAIQVRAQDLKREDVRRSIVQQANVQQTNNTIRPANVPQPQPLAPNERGRLGQNPPRAASGLAQQAPQQPGAARTQEGAKQPGPPGTTGTAPEQRGGAERGKQPGIAGQAPERGQQQGLRERGPQPGTIGRAPERAQEQQGRRERGPQPGTVGRAPERAPEQGLRERGPQPGTVGRAPERAPEQGLRERGSQPGTVGRAPERAPEQGLRERGPQPGTVGRAPERAPEQGRREHGPQPGSSGRAPE